MQSTYYDQNELSALNQKINHRFIRNVYKPPKRTRLLHSSEIMPSEPPQYQMDQPRPLVIPQEDFVNETPPPPQQSIIMATPSPYYYPEVTNCRHVADHTTNCPVCCKLYKGYDALYLTIIAILVIIIMFLIKKIFTNNK